MSQALKVEDPSNYIHIIRTLFRSINNVKCDALYREFQPLLPMLLAGCNRLQVLILAVQCLVLSCISSPSLPQPTLDP
jgi:hypothetical protein